MSVARIITESPEQCEELVRQLNSAGYTVKFAAPEEEFDDADLIVSAATVHADYALQYAAEVAQECSGQVIVAPGVVRGSEIAPAEPAAPVQEALPESSEPLGERLSGLTRRMQGRWQEIRDQRALSREQKRLERERLAMEAEERRQEALRMRAAEETRMAAERGRLRMERQAREAEAMRAAEEQRARAEAERERIAAEAARIAAQREQIRLAKLAEEDARRREAEAERERAATQAQPAPEEITPVYLPVPMAESQMAPPGAVHPVAPQRPVSTKRRVTRGHNLQRAVVAASIVALVLMIVFAIAINSGPRIPIPNGVANSTVQEESPFGPAHSATVATPPVVHAAARVASSVRPATTTPRKPAAARPARRTRRSDGADVAQDEVIIHHYGAQQKHPQSTHTSAGIPHYSDQE